MEPNLLGTLLLYGGFAVMVIAILAAALVSVIFWLSGRKLNEALRQEYGRKRC